MEIYGDKWRGGGYDLNTLYSYMKLSNNKIKCSVESLMNRMGHKKDRIVGVKTQYWYWNKTQSKSGIHEWNIQDL